MRIYNNIPAIGAYNSLSSSIFDVQNSIEKLSTGLKVNGAADDAAGLAISEKMRAQITGIDAAGRNAQDGISLIQTAEGALQETSSLLHRMRELAVQGANDTMTQQDRRYIQLEIEQLKEEINRIATTTIFNKKKLLDGSSSVLWSSDSVDTRLFVRGGLRQVDRFGQKKIAEGNYRISIDADPGQAEVQKSDIFKIKHKNVLSDVWIAKDKGVLDVRVDGLPAGGYAVSLTGVGAAIAFSAYIAQTFGGAENIFANLATGTTGLSGTAKILIEVTNVNTATNVAAFKAVALVTRADGTSETYIAEGLNIGSGLGVRWTAFGLSGSFMCAFGAGLILGKDYLGAKAVVSYRMGSGLGISVNGTDGFVLDSASISNKDIALRNFYLNTMNGQANEASIILSFGVLTSLAAGGTLASFKSTYVGQTARLDTQLRDIDKFWNSEGRFLLANPARIDITQGDGTNTVITLYSTDTIKDVQDKLNAAYAQGLGQQFYLDSQGPNDAGKFATFVVNETKNTSEAAAGTFVLRSIVNGRIGTVRLSGDEDLIKALSLNIIQEARENQYYVSIQDAHSGQSVASNVKVAGNVAVGLLHPNLDFEFKSSADMSTVWNDIGKSYDTKSKDASAYQTMIHIADNSVVFHIGANEGEDMGVDIADMSTRALGVHRVLATDIDSSRRSITTIDTALDKISAQRAKLGAYQNRLEHTITNLSVAAENLTASESRIRDLDMAKEVMTYTKLNIMVRAGNSMLSQANQMPRSVLALLR